MKWYDYAFCILIADAISVCILTFNPFLFILIMLYLMYEDWRKENENG